MKADCPTVGEEYVGSRRSVKIRREGAAGNKRSGNFLTRVVIFPARANRNFIFECCGGIRLRAAGEGAGIHDAGGRSVHGEAVELADVHHRAPEL